MAASGGRKAAAITLEELKSYIDKTAKIRFGTTYDLPELIHNSPQLTKDLDKIEFDMENYEHDEKELERPNLLGYRMLGKIPVLGCYAGGDWESPVVFFLYLDNKKKLRAYLPTAGNPHNADKKSAFGNNRAEDFCDDKFDPKDPAFKGCDEEVALRVYGAKLNADGEVDLDEVPFDWRKMEAAVIDRIAVEGASTDPAPSGRKADPGPSTPTFGL